MREGRAAVEEQYGALEVEAAGFELLHNVLEFGEGSLEGTRLTPVGRRGGCLRISRWLGRTSSCLRRDGRLG